MELRFEKVFIFVIVIMSVLNEYIATEESIKHQKITHQNSLNIDLNHLAVDINTGNVYVGGRNKLFQLTSELQNIAEVEIGPQNASVNCDFDCPPNAKNEQIDNINKVLLIDYNQNQLIVCNTLPFGACSTRSLQNISLPEGNVKEMIVAKTEDRSTVAFINRILFSPNASTAKPTSVMYVGVSAVKIPHNQKEVPAVSTRSLEKDHVFNIPSVNQTTGTLLRIRQKLPIYPIRYVYGFSSEGFAYFLTTQLNHSSPNATNEYITKLVRVCQNDLHYYSYTEIPVDCEGLGVKFNLVQAAFVAKPGEELATNLGINTTDDVLYAVFSEGKDDIPSNISALCIYSLKSIRRKFMENIQSCFNGHGSKGLDFIHHHYDNKNNACINTNLTITEDFCGSKLNYPIGGEQAIKAIPVATYGTRLTAVAAIQHRRFTIAFVGTADGHLKKIHVESNTTAHDFGDIEIHNNSAVSADLQFDPPKMNLYVMTRDRVTKVKAYDCADFSHCPECSSEKDPYCEWCFIENKCIATIPRNSSNISNLYVIGVVIVLIVLIFGAIYVIIIINGKREEQLVQKSIHLLTNIKEENSEKISTDLISDELAQAKRLPCVQKYEFPREKLDINWHEILGEGFYGVVFKGVADGIVQDGMKTDVAVKQVKTNEATDALIKELKIMCDLGKHLNVVNLLGVVTENVQQVPGGIMIIVEYCQFGNLQKILQNNRSAFIDQIDPENDTIDYRIINNNRAGMGQHTTIEPGYRPHPLLGISELNRQIITTDLVCWAFQIAKGMDYLASQRVLHSDLAARNVLLCDDNVVKICDFGLARSLYKRSSIYHKKGKDPLPVKWLALESLCDNEFNTKTDVWAFGVLLSELFSLGEVPYPGIDDDKIYDYLKSGGRIKKPEYATEDIYRIMRTCWHKNPVLRPSFDKLSEMISMCVERSIVQRFINKINELYKARSTTVIVAVHSSVRCDDSI